MANASPRYGNEAFVTTARIELDIMSRYRERVQQPTLRSLALNFVRVENKRPLA